MPGVEETGAELGGVTFDLVLTGNRLLVVDIATARSGI